MGGFRIGHGYDVHVFTAGDHVTLGGVRIPYTRSLLGHSDADGLTHAVCDAVLGAAGLRDIGYHFPDTDDAWKGADSVKLLERCVDMAAEKGWVVENVDVTVIAQKPKLLPHIEAMRARLREALARSGGPADVNVKATTHEGIGCLGRGEGIGCHAVALLTGK
jgi:2-C-methyl-D-erythritol 2,4-cyclodiphosphate synthase